MRSGCQARALNVLAMVFLALSVVSLGWIVVIAVNPYGPLNPVPPAPLAGSANLEPLTPFVLAPTATGTKEQATPTSEAGTNTPPSPPEVTPTDTNTPTPSPALERQGESTSPAILALTPTVTLTPTATASVTPRPSPTRSAFTYTASITYQVHPVQVCDWMGVAGTVMDLQGKPALGAFVHVWGLGSVDESVAAGDQPNYGGSGWEVRLARAQIVGAWNVQLISSPETKIPLSAVYTISMPGDCKKNLARVNFQQNH
jgi:hypothetical protein